MTDLDKVKLYTERVKRAQNDLDRWKPSALGRIKRYRNEPQVGDFTLEGHRISTPSGVGIIDSMFSSLTAVDVEVNIHPWAQGTIDQARVAEQAVMEIWRDTKVGLRARGCVKDALLVGLGWVKVGYEYASHTEIQPRDPAAIETDINTIYDVAAENGEAPPEPEVAAAAVDVEEKVEVVDRDRVVVDYVPWDTVVWDPAAKRVEDMRWIAQITYLPLSDVQGNPEWREYVKKHSGQGLRPLDDLRPDSRVKVDDQATDTPVLVPEGVEVDDDLGRVAIVEYWDLTDGGTFCTFPLSSNFLLNEQPNPFGFNEDMEDRNPFVPLVLRSNPNHVRGISDMELIEPSLQELNRYRSILVNYLERFTPKIYGPEQGITDSGKEALQGKSDKNFVGLEQNVSASEYGVLTPPPLPQEVFGMVERIENHIREATGVSEVMRGLFPDRKRTATETTEVVAASSARQSEKRSLMEDFYSNIARRILQLIQTYYDVPRITRLVEAESDVVWEWDNESVTMEVDLEVVLAPKVPRDSAWREERAMKLMNFVAPILPQPELHPLARIALRDMGFPKEIIREVLPTPEELQEQQQKQAAQEADAAAMQAEAQAVGAASGDPTIPGGINGPAPDDLTMQQQMGPEGVLADMAAQNQGPLDYAVGP